MALNVHALLTGKVRRTPYVHRYSGVPVLIKESVAEHTFHTALYCAAIGMHLEECGILVDFGKLLFRSIFHDLEEGVTGDIRRDIKHTDPELAARVEKLGYRYMEDMCAEVGMDRDRVLDAWSHDKDDSVEGQVMRVADAMTVVAYIHREINMGNKLVQPIVPEVLKYLSDVENEVALKQLKALAQDAGDLLR